MLGREAGRKNYYKTQHLGNDYLHVAVDDATRLAFVRCYQEDTGAATTRFLLEATAFFARQGIAIQAVMTDNAKAYTVSKLFRAQVSALGLKHLVTRPFRPCTNGKAERFIRTLLNEWAYSQLYRSNVLRLQQLLRWVYFYNSRRHHTALGGSPNGRCQEGPWGLQLGQRNGVRISNVHLLTKVADKTAPELLEMRIITFAPRE